MTDKLKRDIHFALEEMTLLDLTYIGEWRALLQDIEPLGMNAVVQREEQSINVTDIKELDRFLFESRKFRSYDESYNIQLEQGIKMAIKTSDNSLIETICIILQEGILEHKAFLSLALEKAKSNQNIHRVLYNSLREKIPEIRGYNGDGGTSLPW